MSMKAQEMSIEDEIRSLMNEPSDEPAKEEVLADDQVEVEAPTEEVKTETPKAAEPVKEAEPVEAPPVSLSGAIKEKWKDLPADVRAEWKKREDDMHRTMTAHDGELRVGRAIKEIAAPYEAVIRSEGGTVEGAFKDLLNTAYVLRTGSPQQKANLILQTAQQFGVDLVPYLQGQQGNNPIVALQEQIHALKQQADPEKIRTQLQEDFERDRIKTEIEAFAANPQNVHFQTVRTAMGSLMSTGRAKNLQEAYEMAIWADPSIRTDLLKAQQAQEAEKKKAEMAAKKKAAGSVTGSPGLASPSTKAPNKSLEDEIRDNLRAQRGEII